MSIIPFCASVEHRAIRFVITPDRLAYVTILATGRKFVAQAAFLRRIADLHPRAVLGSTTVTTAQLDVLTGTPRKEAIDDDARVAISV